MPTDPADRPSSSDLLWIILLVILSVVGIGIVVGLPADMRTTDIVYDDF